MIIYTIGLNNLKRNKMNAKEKARELVDKYANVISDEIWYDLEIAKQCALIAVDEILTQIHNWGIVSVKTYWNEVKQEINEL